MNKGLALILIAVISFGVSADSFRCKGGVIKTGDSVNELFNKCGNAARSYQTHVTVNRHGHKSREYVSNHVYERRGQKDMIVSVQNGKVIKARPD